VVGQGATSTALQLAADQLTVGANATYTATVTPGYGGASVPSGSVEFLDGATPISSCVNRPLTMSSATCTLSYKAAGTHGISARYLADANFAASTSPSQKVTVATKTVTVLKSVSTTMRWTFLHAASYTKVLSLVVIGAPSGGRVITSCAGRGCPYNKRVITVIKPPACKPTSRHRCRQPPSGTLDLIAPFRNSRLEIGTRLIVEVVKRGWVGKYYEFTVQARVGPAVQISCLAPGGSHPGVDC
jgi:hypothetical protein